MASGPPVIPLSLAEKGIQTMPGLTPLDGRSGRTYDWNGETFASVTTILSVLNKPALPRWAAKSTAEFVTQNFPLVADLIGRGERAAAIDLMKNAPWRAKDKAADLGSAVHALVEMYCEGKPLDVPEDDERTPFLRAFLEWLTVFQPKIEESEVTVFNRQTGPYAGTLDLICTIGGLRWLIDVKTGKGVYPEFSLQIAAYSRGEFIGRRDGSEAIMPIIDRGAVLHLRPDHYEFRPVDIGEETFTSFRYILEAFRWQHELSDSAIHPPVLSLGAINRGRGLASSAPSIGSGSGESLSENEKTS